MKKNATEPKSVTVEDLDNVVGGGGGEVRGTNEWETNPDIRGGTWTRSKDFGIETAKPFFGF